MATSIHYKTNVDISCEQFLDVLHRSSLADRRPVGDEACIQGMIENSNLVVSAWDDETLIGLARAVTDFHYACYISDLAVDRIYQKQGVGRRLMANISAAVRPTCRQILIAAPAARDYYQRIGFSPNDRCWVREPRAEDATL